MGGQRARSPSSHATMAASYAAVWANALRARRRRVASDKRAVGAQLVEHGRVVGGIDDDADVGVVLRRRPHHAPGPPMSISSIRAVGERVEVDDDEVDGLDAVARPGRPGARASSRSARMPPCTFGCSVTTRWPRIAGNPVSSATSVTGMPAPAMRLGGAAARHDVPAEGLK